MNGCIFLFPLPLCVRCHSIVDLWLCFCDRVVSLWNSGDGFVGWKGVWCLLSTVNSLCVVCVFQCAVLSCCVVGCGMTVACEVSLLVSSPLSAFLPLVFPCCVLSCLPLVLVFGVVRAQPCEHARYPRTPLCFLVAFLSSLVFCAPPFCVWNGGGGFTMCRCVVLA